MSPVLKALIDLRRVCIAMDNEREHDRPQEAEYQAAMNAATVAIAAEMDSQDPAAKGGDES